MRGSLAVRILAIILVLLTAVSCPAAEVNFAYPKAVTKKGLYITPGMEEDALELGVRHTTINLSAGDFLAPSDYQNEAASYSFSYGGKTYWFMRGAVEQYDRELNRLAQNNVLVTAILLLPFRADLRYLIYPAARNKKANYYQWNMTDESAVETLRAAVTFFQRRYSSRKGARIVGWIVGNEVNNEADWNWCGEVSLGTYMDLYAAQCAAVYQAARSVYANARIYISLDHYWSVGNGSYWYAGKKVLKKFAARMSARGLGKGKWNIAYHPYNVDLTAVDIMAESPAVTRSSGTRIITMKNLSVLTDYVRAKYSKKCRIILSEQGYSSISGGYNAASEQARSVALAYYIAQNNSMVDAMILHRQVDHTLETAVGAAFGLYTSSFMETAANPKPSWTAYKLADTTKTNKYTRKAAAQAKAVTGKTVQKIFTVQTGKLKPAKSLSWTQQLTDGAAGYGAIAGISRQNGGWQLVHDPNRNANVPWGIRRVGKVNCKKMKKLGFGIQVNGATNARCTVRVRLWSGSKRYFEAKKVIVSGVANALYMNLKNWKYRGKITRIDILVTPHGGGWTGNAGALIYALGIRK